MNEGRVLLDGSVEEARSSPKVQEVYIGSGTTAVAARPRETAAGAKPLLTVKKSSPWKTVDDFVAAVRSNPGQIPYGTSGYLGTVHLAMEMFLNAA